MTSNRYFFVIPPSGAARTVALHAANALKNQIDSVNLKCFDTGTYQTAFSQLMRHGDETVITDILNQSCVISCLDFGATHCISAALSPVTLFSLNLLKKQGVKTVHWFYEDYQRARYWSEVISGYDYFCAIQKGALPNLCSKAGSHYYFLPTAHAPGNSTMSIRERKSDIAFIGIPSIYRISVLEKLAQSGFRLSIAGSGWDRYQGMLESMIVCRTWTDEETSRVLLSNARLGINLSVEDPSERSDVHISPRVYDILAAGCILLTENVALAHESLKHCTFHIFNDQEELCKLARAILDNYTEEFNQTKKNIQAILSHHTYENRIRELLKLLS